MSTMPARGCLLFVSVCIDEDAACASVPWLVTWCIFLELTLNIHIQLQQEAAWCFRPYVLTTVVEVCPRQYVRSATKRLPAISGHLY